MYSSPSFLQCNILHNYSVRSIQTRNLTLVPFHSLHSAHQFYMHSFVYSYVHTQYRPFCHCTIFHSTGSFNHLPAEGHQSYYQMEDYNETATYVHVPNFSGINIHECNNWVTWQMYVYIRPLKKCLLSMHVQSTVLGDMNRGNKIPAIMDLCFSDYILAKNRLQIKNKKIIKL